MKIAVVYPQNAHKGYKISAEIFASLAEQTAGASATLVTDRQQIPECDLTVMIGTDAVNRRVADMYLERRIDDFHIRYNTEEYRIYTAAPDCRPHLFIAGGRPRANIYAVYRYFEKFLGARWFWDGDRIKSCRLITEGIDLYESPRFEYRGIRYFAHRSLHRFQAEHWDVDDWRREIDWMLKKRLNTFMLRIGLDDLFQKAFPEYVPYPDPDAPSLEGGINHHDRTPFWSLQHRGELRRKILAYAFERDLMHPEDCGTVTHWYSRTPRAYLDAVKPRLLLGRKYNGEDTAQTWDILEDENLENYFKLTEAHIREYGKPELFHTIGLAERSFSDDPEVNMRLKLYVYRRISSYLKEKYPKSPLFIASWDIYAHTPDEAQRLLSELDPDQAILLDYTSDSMVENNFTNWGVVGKFPWIFGMFSAFEPDNEIRGFYDHTRDRLMIAKNDPMCRGAIFWPELSHGDTFATEFITLNAWERDTLTVEQTVEKYCRDRYSPEKADAMLEIWSHFMPIVRMRSWSPINSIDMNFSQNSFVWMESRATFKDEPYYFHGRNPEDGEKNRIDAVLTLRRLSEIVPDDEMLIRDTVDVGRTVISRYVDIFIRLSELRYFVGGKGMEEAMVCAHTLLECLSDLLYSHSDFSLLDSFTRLSSSAPVNPCFETTLKRNATGYYCRSYISENVKYLYLPEMDIIFGEVCLALSENREIDRERIKEQIAINTSRFFETPLSEMGAGELPDIPSILRRAADIIASSNFTVG